MAFAPATSNYFANAVTTAGVNIPFGDLPSIASQGEADDIREVVYSILNQVADVYLSLDPATERTTSMTVNRSTSMVDSDTIRKTFTVSLLLDATDLTVVD